MLEKIQHLETLVAEAELRLRLIPESVWSDKSSVEKWSKKEILGHLIDSAQNNLRRLIVTQNERPEKVIYDQDFGSRHKIIRMPILMKLSISGNYLIGN